MRSLLVLLFSLIGLVAAEPAFIPLPAKVEMREGRFLLDASTAIAAPSALANEANYLAQSLRRIAALPVPMNSKGTIRLAVDSALPVEGYVLEITPAGVTIRGGSPAGVFYGAVTFLQCLPADVFGTIPAPKADWSAPALRVEDAPLCTWRGLHLDSSRHFQPKEFIFKFLTAMAAQKLNRFHWHLIDSEGWRLEIKKYPRLTQVSKDFPARYPEEIPTNPSISPKYRYGHLHGGGYYTQDDVREIVAHAARLHITIIPEIAFPGHAMAAQIAYPEISTTGKPPVVISNITTDLVGVHPVALKFLRDVLDETMELFPGKWIHFGGDEAPKQQWKADPYTQRKIDELGLRKIAPNHPEDALQGWLFNEMAKHIGKKGRVAMGWEEIMHGENLGLLDKAVAVMPWLSVANGIKSANAGHPVVHTTIRPFYLDSRQANDPREPAALIGGPHTLEMLHRFELFPSGLTPEGRRNILGAQGQLWSELMPRPDDVEYQAYPRACAIAELTWTAPKRRSDTAYFIERLSQHGARLNALGLNHRRVPPPPGLGWSPEFLATGRPWLSALPSSMAERVRPGSLLRVNFRYTSGTHGLDITSVELLSDGQPVAADTHEGFTGANSRNPDYRLAIPADAKLGRLELRIRASGSGGGDSRGSVELKEE